jgi:hypothetical protein
MTYAHMGHITLTTPSTQPPQEMALYVPSETESIDSLITLQFHDDIAEATLNRSGGNRISLAIEAGGPDDVREVAASSARALLIRVTMLRSAQFLLRQGGSSPWLSFPGTKLPRISVGSCPSRKRSQFCSSLMTRPPVTPECPTRSNGSSGGLQSGSPSGLLTTLMTFGELTS